MVSNYPQSITMRENVSARDEAISPGVGEKVLDRLRHFACALHGHDTLLQFDHGRMFLRCMSCGHETPGWDVVDAASAVMAKSESRHSVAPRQPFISGERRIA
jgi:hypothetical protein